MLSVASILRAVREAERNVKYAQVHVKAGDSVGWVFSSLAMADDGPDLAIWCASSAPGW